MRILALILQRIAWLVPTLAGLVAVVFFISRVIPADPVSKLAGRVDSAEGRLHARGTSTCLVVP